MSIYSSYNFPTTLHVILFHGKETFEHAESHSGPFCEKSQESYNKYNKYYKAHDSRKIFGLSTNEYVFYVMIKSSDSYIYKFLQVSHATKYLVKWEHSLS